MDELTSVVLDYFRTVLLELDANCDKYGTSQGTPPTFLIVEQTEPSTHPYFNTGKTLRRWRVTRESIEEFDGHPDDLEQKRNGMYYSFGHGNFSVRDNGSSVRVGWGVGPLYARGFDFTVIGSNEGTRLTDEKLLWVS